MKLALKIDVDTLRGTQEGVPRLVNMLQRHGVQATFLFAVGTDNSGRAMRRALRPGFMRKVARNGVVGHYGMRTLLYGTILPGPDIGRRCADILRKTARDFDVGLRCWDHVRWRDNIDTADNDWTAFEMQRAFDRFRETFGEPARSFGAAGWQMNRHALRLTQRLGFDYASDSRGAHPFLPVIDGELIHCPQVPTTLPTLDELLCERGVTSNTVHEQVLALTETPGPAGHVFTLRAELEGIKLAPIFERLLEGWRHQGYELTSLRALIEDYKLDDLPRHQLARGTVSHHPGTLMVQGDEYLADY